MRKIREFLDQRILAGAITGNINRSKWQACKETDFYTLKGIIESVLEALNIKNRVEFHPVSDAWLICIRAEPLK
ncbi:MAG: hypothetical protein MZV70_76990 [Desulfobacterales bacterium]|nr:hypothetical protein [Desulfobacterales bacterium]